MLPPTVSRALFVLAAVLRARVVPRRARPEGAHEGSEGSRTGGRGRSGAPEGEEGRGAGEGHRRCLTARHVDLDDQPRIGEAVYSVTPPGEAPDGVIAQGADHPDERTRLRIDASEAVAAAGPCDREEHVTARRDDQIAA